MTSVISILSSSCFKIKSSAFISVFDILLNSKFLCSVNWLALLRGFMLSYWESFQLTSFFSSASESFSLLLSIGLAFASLLDLDKLFHLMWLFRSVSSTGFKLGIIDEDLSIPCPFCCSWISWSYIILSIYILF